MTIHQTTAGKLHFAQRISASQNDRQPWRREEAIKTDFGWHVEPDILYWVPKF